jgi:transcriptional regulator with XRE-family HTH domain
MAKTSAEQQPPTRLIRDKAFAKRVETACDNHPMVPAYNFGRLTWMVKQFADRFGIKISPETARKWAAGEARPRPDKMRFLAQLLEVDEAWLSLGTAPGMTPRERRTQAMAISGAANILLGFMQLDGAACAYPDEHDPRGDIVDFYAIIKGAQYAVRAALAVDEGDKGKYLFTVPNEYEMVMVIGLIRRPDLKCDFVELQADLVDKHKVRKGGYYEIEVERKDEDYVTGKDVWPKIRTFAQRL